VSISDNLLVLDEQEIQNKNFVNHFLPFRSQSSGLDFEAIAGSILTVAFQKRLEKGSTLERFKSSVFSRLQYKLTDRKPNGERNQAGHEQKETDQTST